MKETIKANVGYVVRKAIEKSTGNQLYILTDGECTIMYAQVASYDQYKIEKAENEEFMLCEIFRTKKGNTFIYWRDNELDLDYLTKVEELDND